MLYGIKSGMALYVVVLVEAPVVRPFYHLPWPNWATFTEGERGRMEKVDHVLHRWFDSVDFVLLRSCNLWLPLLHKTTSHTHSNGMLITMIATIIAITSAYYQRHLCQIHFAIIHWIEPSMRVFTMIQVVTLIIYLHKLKMGLVTFLLKCHIPMSHLHYTVVTEMIKIE